MIFLKVPYAEKDEAKALGARWNAQKKSWYIPEGQAATPFERWMLVSSDSVTPKSDNSPARVQASVATSDSHGAKPIAGKYYIALEHNCNPFVECSDCLPILLKSGWLDAHNRLRKMLEPLAA